MKATAEQLEQIEDFFTLIREGSDDILLHPIIDEKTHTERLSVCAVDRETNSIYMLGFLFLPYDPLYERFSFKQPPPDVLTSKPPGFLRKSLHNLRKFIHLLRI